MFPHRLVRIVAMVTAAAGAVLVLLGLALTSLSVFIASAVIAMLAGLAVAMRVHNTHPDKALALRVGAAGSAMTLAAGLVIAGLVALFGAVAVPIVLPLLAAGGIWVHRHRGSWLDHAQHGSERPPRWPLSIDPASTPPSRSTPPTDPLIPADLQALDISAATTSALRAAWKRSYWLLSDLPPVSPHRLDVVHLREKLLEELERRDPAGFQRWIHTQPRACSDPGNYLTADH